MRSARTPAPTTSRSAGSSTGERWYSAAGWVSPRPSRREAPRNSSPPTTSRPMTKTSPATSVVDRCGARDRVPGQRAVRGVLALRVRCLDDADDLVDVVGDVHQVEVGGTDRAGLGHGAADPVDQAGP